VHHDLLPRAVLEHENELDFVSLHVGVAGNGPAQPPPLPTPARSTGPEARRSATRSDLAIVASAFGLAMLLQLALVQAYGHTKLGGVSHWILDDDFMISQGYARNLARGQGLVFNRGERVEGFSNPLTVILICLPLEMLRVEPRMLGLLVSAINAAAHGLIAVFLLGRPRTWMGAALCLAYVSLPHHAFYARAGLEVYIEALLLVAAASRLRQGGALFYAALAALPLAHATGLPLWLGLVAARLFFERRRLGAEARLLALCALPFFAYEAFRIAYYGELLPNTYALKSEGITAPLRGLLYVLHGSRWVFPLLVIAAVGAWRARRGARLPPALLLILLPYLLFVIKAGGDNFPWFRFLFVLLPLLLYLGREWTAGIQSQEAVAVVVAVAVAAQFIVNVHGHVGGRDEAVRLLAWDARMAALGQAINTNTRPEQNVALFATGNAGYFSDRHVIDMLGKTDWQVAHTRPKLHRQVGHQKDDPDYVMSRRPDYVELDYEAEDLGDIERLERDRRGRWGYFADLALNEGFRRDYGPVESEGGEFRLYARKDLGPQRWTVLPEVLAPQPSAEDSFPSFKR
jgi:arabinofuranosyltransferase